MTDDKKKLSPEELEEVAGGASDNDIDGFLACDDGSDFAPASASASDDGVDFAPSK
ncbi:hypothetical protein [Arabiibacter massiliensis]|uniref:hypothetical protein n=1 Tax=Arabiibacter massiliensis TaxID=1870985 RepID=UPI00155B252E|nr:hypothetical protein [Arabiibacter massiliensis]